jgi:NTE family protein
MTTTALVLGSGGQTGGAWQLGILAGLQDAGVDVTDADVVIGTSAGSVVGAQLRAGVPVDRLYADQLAPPTSELAARLGLRFRLMLLVAGAISSDAQAFRRRVGARALRAKTIPADRRRAVVATRLPSDTWTDRSLRIVTIDAATGEDVVFDRDTGVSLVDAVAASCAVPTVWPCTPINGRRFMDGGMRSWVNADLAAGAARIVVLAPMHGGGGRAPQRSRSRKAQGITRSVEEQVAVLRETAAVALVTPDAQASAAMGSNILDPARRKVSAEAGLCQSDRIADEVREVWTLAG